MAPCSASSTARRKRRLGCSHFPLLPALAPLSPEGPCLFGQAEILELQDVQSQVFARDKAVGQSIQVYEEAWFWLSQIQKFGHCSLSKRQLKIKSKALTTVKRSISSTSCTGIFRTSPRISLSPSVVRSSQVTLDFDLNTTALIEGC